jgi:hypothetical protein
MSLYVQPENQQLLWNTIQKIPNIQAIPQGDREIIFKNTIKTLYENNRHRSLSSSELKELNKQTVQNMAQVLNSRVLKQNTKINQNNINYTITENNGFRNPSLNAMRPVQPISEVKGNRQEGYTMEVANRQREYDNMMKREVPPEPNFKEAIDDRAIENMEELLQQQLKQRELDIQNISGPMPTQNGLKGPKRTKHVEFVTKLDLSGGNTPVDINVQEIPIMFGGKTESQSGAVFPHQEKSIEENTPITKNDLTGFHHKLDILFEIVRNIQHELVVIKNGIIMEFGTVHRNMANLQPLIAHSYKSIQMVESNLEISDSKNDVENSNNLQEAEEIQEN